MAAEIPTCGKCGLQHLTRTGKQACTAHCSGGQRPEKKGAPCSQSPKPGSNVCTWHGGAKKANKARAEQRILEAKAKRLMATFGEPVDVDPADELLDLICRTAGHVRWLRIKVDETMTGPKGEKALVWGKTKTKVGGDDGGTTWEATPNVWLQMYERWTDRLAKLCVDAIRIGLDERRVRLAEQHGEILVRILDGVLTELGLDPNNPETAAVVERHLKVA